MANTNPTTSQSSVAIKANITGKQNSDIELIVSQLNVIMDDFPQLKKVPEAMYVILKTFYLESGFRMVFSKNRGNTADGPNGENDSSLNTTNSPADSSHYTPTSSVSGECRRYWECGPIRAIRYDPVKMQNPDIVKGINQGRVAHAISAVMGWYFIEGTPEYNEMIGKYPGIISKYGLHVKPGDLVSSLFPDTTEGRRKAIAAGVMIFNDKFLAYKRNGRSDSLALYMAVGGYVGAPGTKDANGYSPSQRQQEVYATNSSIGTILSAYSSLGVVTPDGLKADIALVDTSQSMLGSTTTSPNTNRVATTTSTPLNVEGCSKPS